MRITTWCDSKATHVNDRQLQSRFMLVARVNIYKSFIICYLLLYPGKVRTCANFPFEGNVSQGWKLWLKHFEFCQIPTEKERKSDKVKTSVLLTWTKQKGRQIYEAFNFDNPGDEMRRTSVLRKVIWILQPKEEHHYTSS